jgi:hypothetical protein
MKVGESFVIGVYCTVHGCTSVPLHGCHMFKLSDYSPPRLFLSKIVGILIDEIFRSV